MIYFVFVVCVMLSSSIGYKSGLNPIQWFLIHFLSGLSGVIIGALNFSRVAI